MGESLTRWQAVALTAAVAAVAATVPLLIARGLPTRPLADTAYLLGAIAAMFAISWAVAGIVYLISLMRASRGALVATCIVTSLLWGYLSYKGMTYSP